MSTPEHSDSPQLTRKQMREHQRETGAVPITSAPAPAARPQPVAIPPVPPLPRPAEPAAVPPAPVPDASVDLGVSPLTRRQARQQERIRTASVPVITPEVAAAHNAATAAAATTAPAAPLAPVSTPPTFDHALTAPAPRPSEPEPLTAASSLRSLFDSGDDAATSAAPAPVAPTPTPAAAAAPPRDEFADALASLRSGSTPVQSDRPTVGSAFGASLKHTGATPAPTPAPAEDDDSFDRVLSRDTATNGSVASPHTLIVSQNPTAGPISAPISSTGEILVTGTYALPDGLGSMGHVPGAADGKEADAILVDGELPVHSSPTPIAASAAISTAKGQDELIRPPSPEKNSRLMLTLAITAGVLALALVGVLVVAFVTGVFTQ
jgi:hypothetical protein